MLKYQFYITEMISVLSICVFACFVAKIQGEGPIVQLPNGLIQGRQDVTITNKTFYAFEKIPYASAPVGNLRFKAPVPHQDWNGTLNTTYLDVTCYQLNTFEPGFGEGNQSENCLFVNVFTPQLPNKDVNVSLPVMLFIHGGAFCLGSSIGVYSDILLEKDVLLVTINYRLGIFGFLSTQDEVIPGNNGLKDQLLAIQWTHDNIHLFGGNPDKVTIFGQSAGSISCAYQLLNQKSQGLYQGAILQSGTFLCPSSYQRNARRVAFDTAALINSTFSSSDDSIALLDFLQAVDADTLSEAAKEYKIAHSGPEYTDLYQGLAWAPVIEPESPDAFLTQKMYVALHAGDVVKVPILIGTTSEESLGLIDYTNFEYLNTSLHAFDEHLAWLVPNDMRILDEANRTKVGQMIREIYTGGEPFGDNLGAGVRFYSEAGFAKPAIKTSELYSKYADTYHYMFSYDGEIGHNNNHYDGAESVGHAEDLNYLFCGGTGCDFTAYSEDDQATVERMVTLWTNFAKYQNPTPEPIDLLQNVTWPTVSTENGDLLYLNINETLEIKNHPKEQTFAKWVAIYDNLGYDDFDTY